MDYPTLRQWLGNFRKPPIAVRHTELERAHEESPYRSKCPACGLGILLVMRDQKTFALLARDRCIRCGQQFDYLDDEIEGQRLQR